MFNAFGTDTPNPFADFFQAGFDAEAVRSSSYEQGVKVLELQRKMATAQLDQLMAITEASQKQAAAFSELQAKAMRDGLGMVLDAQKSAVDMWKPAAQA